MTDVKHDVPKQGPVAHAAAAPAAMMTEQEKDAKGPSKGVGPVTHSEVSPGPVETLEDLNIGPREPYPEGNPPPPAAEDLARIEAAKKAPSPPVNKERK